MASRIISASVAWCLAMLTLLVVCGPLLMGIGIARGWNTINGTYSFYKVEDPTRFWPEPNEYNETVTLDAVIPGRNFVSASSNWYYWKLRPSGSDPYCNVTLVPEMYTLSCQVPNATAVTRAFVWICYVVHQCAIWGIIYKAQLEHRNDVQYHTGLRWYNIWSFAVNLSAHLLHLIQTHLTYDATAQDVTESSSQGSVIMLIVMIMMIEYKHRGIFLGWPAAPDNDKTGKCSWRLPTRPMELVRKYHGYAFSWATIYTFWYHPMEPSVGHVMGFLHTGALLIQQSLMFTPIHVNKYWKLLLETWVAIHGAVVAVQMRQGQWSMFLFGFLWVVAFTSIHGLPYYLGFVEVSRAQRNGTDISTLKNVAMVPKSQGVRYLIRLIPPAAFFAMVLAVYATTLRGQSISEIIRIPSTLYLFLLFTFFVGWGMISVTDTCFGNGIDIPQGLDETAEVLVLENAGSNEDADPVNSRPRVLQRGIGTGTVMVGFLVCYVIMIAVSVIIEQLHVPLNLLFLMIICVAVFTILALVGMVLQDSIMHRTFLGGPQLPSAEVLQ